MPYDYFLASRYRNKEKILPFIKRIRETGKSVYCFIESEASVKYCGTVECEPEAAMKEFESIPDWRNSPRVREIFETDMQALKDSDALILLLPAGKSAHMEVGVAYGLGKRLVLVGEQKETESLYLMFDQVFGTEEEFLRSIRGGIGG
ncbi:MAG: hypothetical protein AAB558_01840 [Patescibacteria group bacterium]